MAPDHLKFDIENGDPEKENRGQSIYKNPNEQGDTGDEYSNLVRYINQYHEGPRRKSVASLGDDVPKKKPWWKFWAGGSKSSGGNEPFEVPDDWVATHIKNGISNSEVESRRKHTGFNELTTEKENMVCLYIPPPPIPSADRFERLVPQILVVCGDAF